MKKVVKRINDLFISLVLLLFYIFAIGFSFLLFKLITLLRKSEKEKSYWEKPRKKLDFSSPY